MIINIILIFIGVLAYYKGYCEGYKKFYGQGYERGYDAGLIIGKMRLLSKTKKPKDMNYGKNE